MSSSSSGVGGACVIGFSLERSALRGCAPDLASWSVTARVPALATLNRDPQWAAGGPQRSHRTIAGRTRATYFLFTVRTDCGRVSGKRAAAPHRVRVAPVGEGGASD